MTHDPRSPQELQREQQAVTARECGYGEGQAAVDALNRDHDRLHIALCGMLGRLSPTLRWVATGYRVPAHATRNADAVGWEEDLALEAARWLNTGEHKGRTLRVLWWWGYDPDEVRAYLLGVLGRPA